MDNDVIVYLPTGSDRADFINSFRQSVEQCIEIPPNFGKFIKNVYFNIYSEAKDATLAEVDGIFASWNLPSSARKIVDQLDSTTNKEAAYTSLNSGVMKG